MTMTLNMKRNNMKRKHHSLTTNTTSPLLSLPEETIIHILSYSLPSKESQQWEWIGVLSQTCRTLRPIAQSLAPSRLFLEYFFNYETCVLNSTDSETIDAREGILQTLCDFRWKRSKLMELHVNGPYSTDIVEDWGTSHEGIRTLLRDLISTPASLPNLEWLDIEMDLSDYDLVDAECLQRMPSALPNLQQLCLGNCVVEKRRGFTPNDLKNYFDSLHKPLVSLSLAGVKWLTDDHVEAIMPSIGKHLTRLELADCGIWVDEDQDLYGGHAYELIKLADRSLISIANSCQKLESFTITESDITSAGLGSVLSNNISITTLNLSENKGLDTAATGLISQYLPRLRVLRNYWPRPQDWLTDDGLVALLEAQERESGGLGISLELIGLYDATSDGPLTIRGLKYAIEKGVQEIETCGALHGSIVALKTNTKLCQPYWNGNQYMDGSHHEREK